MKKWSLFILLIIILTGCRSTPFDGHSEIEIDWVDFIKWDGKTYDGVYTGVLADKKLIGKKIGTVKFKVADNVTNPHYKIKDGDAAFYEKGTTIFSLKGHSNLIAVESLNTINGYQVYYSTEDSKYKWHYKDMPTEKVTKVEIYQMNTPDGTKLVNKLNSQKEINTFLKILKHSKNSPNFQPDTSEKDPTYYEMIFYMDEPIAYHFNLQFDGKTYFWHPWDTSILSKDISLFIRAN
ncbi:hypothetical protein [Niallia sp. 01092]|uniref:hypothetical protein n=1 Tax=unclassified Niallia TaxID=2837522 RepID=UPI003FCEFE04